MHIEAFDQMHSMEQIVVQFDDKYTKSRSKTTMQILATQQTFHIEQDWRTFNYS